MQRRDEHERYLDTISRFATPEELERLFKVLGSPDSAEELHNALRDLIKREEYWQRTKRNVVIYVVAFVKALLGAGSLLTVGGAVWKLFFNG